MARTILASVFLAFVSASCTQNADTPTETRAPVSSASSENAIVPDAATPPQSDTPVAVSSQEPTTPPEIAPTTESAASSEAEKRRRDAFQQSRYLPLVVGNKWTYAKTVSGKTPVVAWEAFKIGEKTQFVFGPVKAIAAGTYEETYSVAAITEEDGRQRWLIDLPIATARDGRYSGLVARTDKVYWGRVVSSEHLIEIGEIQVWEHFAGPYKHQRTLLIDPFLEGVEATLQSLTTVQTKNSAKRASVTVPAGSFSGCLMVTGTLTVPNSGNEDGQIWNTLSWYAPGVGLVKEQQEHDGIASYTLELIKYDLKPRPQ